MANGNALYAEGNNVQFLLQHSTSIVSKVAQQPCLQATPLPRPSQSLPKKGLGSFWAPWVLLCPRLYCLLSACQHRIAPLPCLSTSFKDISGTDMVSEVTRAFERACSAMMGNAGTDAQTLDAHAFAQRLVESAQESVVQVDTDRSRGLIEYAVSAFDTGHGTSVMNEVLFELFQPLEACSRASVGAKKTFESFVERVAAKCNPQECLTLFLATMGEASE